MKKPRAILIIGLPGSGKTYLAKNKYVPMGYCLIDDPSQNQDNYYSMMYHLNITKWDLVIVDPHFCKEKDRTKAIEFIKSKKYNVKCIFMENDEAKCNELLKLRNDGKVITTFEAFNYTIPKGVKPVKIYNPNQPF